MRSPALAIPLPGSTEVERESVTYTLSPALIALEQQVNARTESVRALRTHIVARHLEEGRRSVVVCGATPGVGCSFVASNLAVALSQIGVKTLLVDANLRTPSIDNIFKPSVPVAGLQQCMTAHDEFGNYVQADVLPDLSIMFAGGTLANPQELLASERFSELMNFCLREYHMTILDTPPANTCSDVHRVSTVARYSLVVARKDQSRVGDLKTLSEQLSYDHARVIGTVLTED
jgi:protein-tyrosine kinase